MGIPVLRNPFGAERSARQRLLNAVQQTGDYIMSQQVLMTTSTLATKTLFCSQCHESKNAHNYNCVASGKDKALSHRSVPSENGPPRVPWQVIAEIRPTYVTEYADIARNSKKDMRRVMIWQPPCCRYLSKVTREGQ